VYRIQLVDNSVELLVVAQAGLYVNFSDQLTAAMASQFGEKFAKKQNIKNYSNGLATPDLICKLF
jgi:hypothetical protein